MRLATIFIAAMLLISSVALAGAPLPGTYKSTDIGGLVLVGRQAESWPAPGGAMMAGKVFNLMSWDGANLGTQWTIQCGVSGPPIVLVNTVVGGNGTKIIQTAYTGGNFWLGGVGLGPWANGDAGYPGTITSYTDVTTETWIGGVVTGKVSNINFNGSFTLYPGCMTMDILNYQRVNTTTAAAFDPTYPGLLDMACNPTRVDGEWGNNTGITINILGNCALATQESTWGKIKTMYND